MHLEEQESVDEPRRLRRSVADGARLRPRERGRIAEALTRLESTLAARIDQRTDLRLSTAAAVESTRAGVGVSSGLTPAVGDLERARAVLTERIEAERGDRDSLIEAVGLLMSATFEALSTMESTVAKPPVTDIDVKASPVEHGEAMLVRTTLGGRERPDATSAPVGPHVDVIARLAEVERVVEGLRHLDAGEVAASPPQSMPPSLTMTRARAVDLTTAMHSRESSLFRRQPAPPPGVAGRRARVPVRLYFVLPKDDFPGGEAR